MTTDILDIPALEGLRQMEASHIEALNQAGLELGDDPPNGKLLNMRVHVDAIIMVRATIEGVMVEYRLNDIELKLSRGANLTDDEERFRHYYRKE